MSYTHQGVKVHPEDGRTYTCNICGTEFSTFAAMATHARMQHKDETAEQMYTCGECPEETAKFKVRAGDKRNKLDVQSSQIQCEGVR